MKAKVSVRYLSFKIVSAFIVVFLIISSGICNAQELVISDSLRCFDKDTPVSELLEFVQKGSGSDSTCYLEALALLKALDILPGSKMMLEETDMPPITIGAVMQQKQDTIPPFGVQVPRVGDTKKKSGNRGAKDSSGNSIRVDHDDDAPYNNFSASDLVQEVLVTGCLTASNVTFGGNQSLQIGYFNRGTADFPFEEGIVLSTGNVTDAEGPNTLTNFTTEVNTGGDDQLQSIATGTVQDAAVLEFDFVPAGDTVTFNYIFASEEYPEYACSDFNDVFGFFVTSKDNDGYNYVNENVALLPSGDAVSINNVHGDGRDDGWFGYYYDGQYPIENGCNQVMAITVIFEEDFNDGIGSDWSYDPSAGNWYGDNNKARFDDKTPSKRYNYSYGLVSEYILTSTIFSEIYLSFDLKLDARRWHNTQNEKMDIDIYDGSVWHTIHTFVNSGDYQDSYSFNITPYCGNNIKVRFRTYGDDSEDFYYWELDNVEVYSQEINYSAYFYSLNTNCNGENEQYYIDQSSWIYSTGSGDCINQVYGLPPYTLYENLEADGRTVKLTATFAAVPCSTYHIKLAVGDVGDNQWDSWVFLEANSFQSNDVELTSCSNGQIGEAAIFEGCQTSTNYFVVSRAGGDDSQELAVKIDYSPPGVNGSDILQLDNTLLPDTVFIPAGAEADTVFFYAIADGVPEDPQNNIITMTFYTGCPCDPTPTSIELGFQVYDVLDLTSLDITANNVVCDGQENGVIIANPSGGSGGFEFMLSGAETRPWQSSNTFDGLASGYYNVTVRDELYLLNCNEPITVSDIFIDEGSDIFADAGSDKTICNGNSATLNGSGGVGFQWFPADWLSNPDIASPVVNPTGITNVPVSKTYTLTTTDALGNCPHTDDVVVTVNPTPSVQIRVNGTAQSTINVCPDDNTTLEAYISPETNTGTATYLWSDGSTTSSVTVSPNSSQTYSVTVTNEHGCTKSASIQVLVYPFEVNASIDQDPVCPDDVDGIVTISVTGHSGNLPVEVSVTGPNGYNQLINFTAANPNPVQLSNLAVGQYVATGTSAAPAGCTSTASFTVQSTDITAPQLSYEKAGDTAVVVVIPSGSSSFVSVPTPIISDNCSFSFENDFNNTTNANATYPVGKTTVTWYANDDSDNQDSLKQNVYVVAEADFVLDCPEPTVYNLGYNPEMSDFIEDLGGLVYSPTTTGWPVTGITGPSSTLGDEMPDPSGGGCSFIRTRTYSITWWVLFLVPISDECVVEYSYIVDTEPPALSCPEAVTVSPPIGQTSMTVTPSSPTVSDNCTATSSIAVTSARSDGLPLSDPYPLGTTTITFTATDDAGNAASCEQYIHVVSSCAPGGVFTGLTFWLRSNNGVYHAANQAQSGEQVSLWDDQILNFDAIQNSVTSQPVLSTSINDQINYNPVIQFDGTDDYLLSELPSGSLEETMTLFFVARPESIGPVLGIGASSTVEFSSGNTLSVVINGEASTVTAENSYSLAEVAIVTVLKTGNQTGAIRVFKNGMECTYQLTGNAELQSGTVTKVGSENSAAVPRYFSGSLAEVIFYSGALSETDRMKVESYLAIKYGISL
ncbi:MAG: HYR domain-containing protein [Bacteroidia bacterium]|nr:HYR domain-containing protein [Bacteroidia bacterium]